MKSVFTLGLAALIMFAAIGCTSYSPYGAQGVCPNGYSNTRCGQKVFNDKTVPDSSRGMLAPSTCQYGNPCGGCGNCAGGMGMGAELGNFNGDGYTTRAPRDFFMNEPAPLGY